MYEILFSLCDTSMRQRVEVEPEYKTMLNSNRFDAIKLYQIICKSCNGSTLVIVEDILGNLIEGIYNYFLMSGENHEMILKYHKATEHQF